VRSSTKGSREDEAAAAGGNEFELSRECDEEKLCHVLCHHSRLSQHNRFGIFVLLRAFIASTWLLALPPPRPLNAARSPTSKATPWANGEADPFHRDAQ
jgi:hypothetical protein